MTHLEETLKLVQRGRVLIPDDADPVTFLLTDGKKKEQAKPEHVQTLGELFDAYLASLPPGSKEETTLEGEAIHRRHLLHLLKKRCPFKSLNQQLLQSYINQRLTES